MYVATPSSCKQVAENLSTTQLFTPAANINELLEMESVKTVGLFASTLVGAMTNMDGRREGTAAYHHHSFGALSPSPLLACAASSPRKKGCFGFIPRMFRRFWGKKPKKGVSSSTPPENKNEGERTVEELCLERRQWMHNYIANRYAEATARLETLTTHGDRTITIEELKTEVETLKKDLDEDKLQLGRYESLLEDERNPAQLKLRRKALNALDKKFVKDTNKFGKEYNAEFRQAFEDYIYTRSQILSATD